MLMLLFGAMEQIVDPFLLRYQSSYSLDIFANNVPSPIVASKSQTKFAYSFVNTNHKPQAVD